MANITELREKQQKLVADARAEIDALPADATEEVRAEADRKHDAAMAEYDRYEARIKREEELEAREAALNEADERRPGGEGRTKGKGKIEEDTRTAAEKHVDAFRAYLRNGKSGLTPELRQVLETRTVNPQGVSAAADGGYLVPTGFQAELVKSLKAWGPMLDPTITRVMNTANGISIPWPTMDDTSNTGALIAENTQVALAEVTFGVKTLAAYKYTSGVVLVSSELLQDSALDVETIVRDAMAERIGRIGNTHLTTGTGSSQPQGIVVGAGAGATAAAAAAITFDDMIELLHSVDPLYRTDPSCKWQFNDSTLKLLRKIKDGQGRYIWQPADLQSGAPARILEYGYAINQAMAGVATTNKSVLFGAHNRYVVRLVNDFSIRRLTERYADYDQTGFIGFTRLDGRLLDAGAIKVLVHP